MRGKVWIVNRPEVASESFGDEVIIIHFGSGNYYSLNSFGSLIWSAVEKGASVEDILSALGTVCRDSMDELEKKVRKLVDALIEEDLICVLDGPGEFRGFSPPVNELDFPAGDSDILLRFDDMQELLLLDPIHDVDDSGWPQAQSYEKDNQSKRR